MNKQIYNWVVGLIVINLFLSSMITYAQDAPIDSTIEVGPCVSNCLTLSVPNPINIITPRFVEPDGESILKAFNYNRETDTGIVIHDLRNELPSWLLTAEFSPLLYTIDDTVALDYQNIGVLSFNNDQNYSVDGIGGSPTIESLIDRDFAYEDFMANSRNNPQVNDFTYPTGTNQNLSDPLLIIDTDDVPRINLYSMGIGTIVNMPDAANFGIRDEDFYFNITFTLATK